MQTSVQENQVLHALVKGLRTGRKTLGKDGSGGHGDPTADGRDKYVACNYETDISRDIRVLAEVEKIWIIFDLD